MALLTHPAFQHPVLLRIRETLQSRLVRGICFGIAAALTILAILLALSPPAQGPLGPITRGILMVLGLNMVLILVLVGAVGLQVLELLEARSTDAGARLHVRFVWTFAGAAVVPALVVFGFYGLLVSQGVEKWFSERVQTVVENSRTVFASYVEEQTRYIGDHVTLMGSDLNREAGGLQAKPAGLNDYLAALASYHAFPSAYVVNRQGRVLARAEAQDAPPYMPPPASSFAVADQGEISVPDYSRRPRQKYWFAHINSGD